MTKLLQLAPNLSLPLEAVTKKFGCFGQNGSGKTYGAMKMAELMLDAGAQIVAIDPVGKWYGLRLDDSGKNPSGIEIPVFGGLHGDIPLESTAGELVADVIVDRGISAVLDVSQFEYDTERARFVEHLARRLFHRKKASPSAMHLFLEEAQEWLPMSPQRGEEKMLHEVLRIGKIGRNFGFGWTLITPRPQEITTKARNLSEVVLAFQTNGTHERKAIAEWVREKGQDLNVVDLLPKLKPGFAHAWSPSWLEFSGTIHINKKRTFDASATPLVGAKAVEAKPLGSIDLAQLQKAMASTIEKAKETDPKLLKAEISRLKRELEAKAGQNGHATTKEKLVVDTAAIDRAVARALADVRKKVAGQATQVRRILSRVSASLREVPDLLDSAIATLDIDLIEKATPGALLAPEEHRLNPSSPVTSLSGTTPEGRAGGHAGRDSRERPAPPSAGSGNLSRGSQQILDALAFYESLGKLEASKRNVAGYCGINPSLSTWRGAMAPLRAQQLISETGDVLSLSREGRALARVGDVPSLGELHRQLLEKLSAGARAIAEELIKSHPGGIERDDLAARVGIDPKISTWRGLMAELRKLGLVSDQRGRSFASDLLFPEGLV